MIVKRLSIGLVLVCLGSVVTQAQAPDPLVGTWKLNVAKSKSPFKSGTTVIEPAGDGGIKVTVDLVGADGTPYHWTWSAKYDGKDNPVTGTTPYGEGTTVAITHVDSHTTRTVAKRAGKVLTTQNMVVSADAKTRTTTTKGTDAKGQPIDTTAVYEKQ
jgi:hypothetical protein